MNASRIILLVLMALVVLLVLTGLIRIAGRRFRSITEVPYKDSPAYAAWFAGTAAMLAISFLPAMNVIMEISDLMYGTATGNTPGRVNTVFVTALKADVVLILLAAVWFWLWALVAEYLIIPVLGKTNVVTEMEMGNMVYFMVRYLVVGLCMFVLLPFYLGLLRYFIPDIAIPFYR